MGNLQNNAYMGIMNFIKRTYSYARYKIGSTWTAVDFDNVDIGFVPGRAEVSFTFTLYPSGSGIVSDVEIFDINGQKMFAKSESLNISGASEGFRYTVKISLKEVST